MSDFPLTGNPAPYPHSPRTNTDTSPVVVFRNVTIAFEGPPVLEDISFSVAPGETRILLGPAGVGKSVLLKLANGLLRPDEGSILLFGEEISHMPEEQLFALRSRTGMVFQEGALFDSLSVRDNVAYQLVQERVPDDEIDQRAGNVHLLRLDRAGPDDALDLRDDDTTVVVHGQRQIHSA